MIALADQEKCIKPFVLNVRKSAKYLSNLQQASQFFAKNVTLKKLRKEDFNNLFLFFVSLKKWQKIRIQELSLKQIKAR